jgi:plastocyanin
LVLALPVAAAAIALLAGCSSSGSPSSGSPSSAPATSASSAAGGGTAVTATETEFHIALSQTSFTPGTYTFTAVNKGQFQHNLVINGPGVDQAQTAGLLNPGQSEPVTVTLSKGSYEIYCGVPGHKEQGMDVKITVS